MCLNASLAGLVGITAGCDVLDCTGAIIVGVVSGLIVNFGVWFLDNKLHIDDPVGAVAVHFLNGIWGTLAVGLLATGTTPDYPEGMLTGLFYGGGFELLGLQLLGVLSVCAWTAVTITLTFLLIKAIFGLRVSREEEIAGLDIMEHGLASGYADFMPATSLLTSVEAVPTVAVETPKVSVDDAVPVVVRSDKAPASDVKMTKVSILCKQSSFEVLKTAMEEIGVTGMTVSQVLGCGMQKGRPEYYRGVAVEMNLLPKVQVDIVVCKIPGSHGHRHGEEGAVLRAHWRRQDLRVRRGERHQGAHGRRGLRRAAGRGINPIKHGEEARNFLPFLYGIDYARCFFSVVRTAPGPASSSLTSAVTLSARPAVYRLTPKMLALPRMPSSLPSTESG